MNFAVLIVRFTIERDAFLFDTPYEKIAKMAMKLHCMLIQAILMCSTLSEKML